MRAHSAPKSNAARALVAGIVADTGATVRVIGAVHKHLAQNGRALVRSVLVETANGEVEVTREADLPALGMENSLDMTDHCASSLLPVVPVCEELGVGFQIAQGGGRARFYKGGRTVAGLGGEGRLFIEPVGSLVGPDTLQVPSLDPLLVGTVRGVKKLRLCGFEF